MKANLTTRSVEFLVGILATGLIATGLMFYALNEPARLETAQAQQLSVDLDGAMTAYAQNCAVCHGPGGEGIGATPGLAALKEMDEQALSKIIARGLYGTAMPAWSLEDGGPLSDYQIGQLVQLIKRGDWQATQERVVNLGLAPLVPFTTQADAQILEAIRALPQGEQLAGGVTLYAEQCVACHGADGRGSGIAPALNDPAVLQKTSEELERSIRLGVPGTLMAGWDKTLADDQIAALLALITRWDEVPQGAVPAPDKPVIVTEESLALGADLFATSCSGCHGPEGQGSQRAPALNVRGFLADTSDMAIQQIITLGVPETSMPAWGDRMTESEIQAIVGFIRSWEANAPEVAEPARIRGPWWRGSTSTGSANPVSGPPQGAVGAGKGQAGGGAGQQGGYGAGGESTQPAWYQTVDRQATYLALAVLAVGLGMILLATAGLRRLERKEGLQTEKRAPG